ncbi:putative ribonuclease H-like domain-containing protein [Tanacetum coccineum]
MGGDVERLGDENICTLVIKDNDIYLTYCDVLLDISEDRMAKKIGQGDLMLLSPQHVGFGDPSNPMVYYWFSTNIITLMHEAQDWEHSLSFRFSKILMDDMFYFGGGAYGRRITRQMNIYSNDFAGMLPNFVEDAPRTVPYASNYKIKIGYKMDNEAIEKSHEDISLKDNRMNYYIQTAKVLILVDFLKVIEQLTMMKSLSPVARIEAIRIFLAYASYMGFMVYQMDVKSAFLYGQIEEEVYVCQPPGFEDPDHPDKVYKVVKALYGLHQADPILYEDPLANYLCIAFKGKPSLGLWYPKDSPLELVAYTDSDYAGATQDRKSTTRGCQFLGNRLISWQCKKQTVVATSTTEAEYVAAANCCGQHNMVAFLEKSTGSEGFHQVIDFLNRSHICYALTKKADVYISFIKQFWRSAEATTDDLELVLLEENSSYCSRLQLPVLNQSVNTARITVVGEKVNAAESLLVVSTEVNAN